MAGGRVVLVDVAGEPRLQVRLRRDGRDATAVVETSDDVLRPVAAATLEALTDLVGPGVVLRLHAVHEVVADPDVVVVVVAVEVAGVPLLHTGSARIRPGSRGESAAKATLDAVNRRLEILGA